jgi:hypothetical protein
MAKNFPFFKFVATEWLTGDIVYEELSTQGLFINICALYWQRDGKLSLQDINKRYKTIIVDNLIDRFFTVIDGNISISFLDEQLIDAGHISKVNSENGKKGAEAKRIKANANRTLSEPLAKPSKEEEEQEEDILPKNLFNYKKCTDIEFVQELSKFKDLYNKKTLNAFYIYWSDKNEKGKMKLAMQDTFEINKRLVTWKNNEIKFGKSETLDARNPKNLPIEL